MDPVTILGVLAGAITTASLLPQALDSHRTKKTHDLSMNTLLLANVGLLAWIAYGIVIWSLPLIMADSSSLLINSGLISLKMRYG